MFFMFLGSCALHPVCRWLRRQSQSWVAFELKGTAASAIAATPIAVATGLVSEGPNHVNWLGLAPIMVWSSSVLFIWCSLYFSIKQWHQSNQEKERLLRAESEVRQARLLALRYQLNPHFLFNSLNAVSTLVLEGNAPAATRMLAQIGDLLRSSLDSEVKSEVTLSREMEFTEKYLAIEQTRLGERLKFEITIPVDTQNALVPSMLLQPLVENAVRYGVAPLVEGGWIRVNSALRAGRLQIVVENSGRPEECEQKNSRSGIGLGNTTERLKTLYGTDFYFSLGWPDGGGCEVILELPLHRVEHLREVSLCVS